MYLSAILLAAGRGLRLGLRFPKPLVRIGRLPAIAYSLAVLNDHPGITDIIVVANPGNREGIAAVIKKCKIKKVRRLVLGGKRRQDSVRNGLKALDERADFILIHDSARPFINSRMVSSVIKAGVKSQAAITGLRVSSTIKSIKNGRWVEKTLDRERLWEIQTPQFFNRRLLLKAYKRYGSSSVTDDAALIEKMGGEVAVVPGSSTNIKITTPQDLALAEAIVKSKKY